MKVRDSRRLGSVKRGRAFGTDHHEVFDDAPDAPKMFDDLDFIGRELEDLFTQQDSNLRSAREAAKTRKQARRTLRRSVDAISGFAQSLGTVGYEEKFSVPRLLDDEGLRTRLGETGRKRALEYDWRRVTASIVDVYHDVLSPPRVPIHV